MCKVDKDSKRCTGCYMVWYCGQECQVGDWPAHKTDCKVTRDQYKQVLLVEQKTAVVNNITKKTHVNYVGDLPSKNHFVVKVQAGVVARPTRDPLLVYNKDRSLLGNLHREEQEVVYDMLVGKIREAGYKGLKGYFYVICSGEGTKSCKKKGKLHNIKINTEKILPVENW